MDAEPDLVLVRRAQAGDERAFEVLVRRHQHRVYSVARGVVGSPDDAADVTQEAFIAVVRHLDSFHEGAAFTTWLHRITLRKAYDHLRRRRPDPLDPGGAVVASLPARDGDPFATAQLRRSLLDSIAELEDGFRDALLLVDVAGMSVGEAALALEVAPGTVKSRVFRARAQLAKTLGTHGIAGASKGVEQA